MAIDIPAPQVEHNYTDTYQSNMNCVNSNCSGPKYRLPIHGTPREKITRPYTNHQKVIPRESRVEKRARFDKNLSNNKGRARWHGRRSQ